MNPVLKDLAAKASLGGAKFDDVVYYVGTEETFSKFAEAVVRECAGLLEKEAESSHDEGTDSYNLLLRESKCMKRYFGVEE